MPSNGKQFCFTPKMPHSSMSLGWAMRSSTVFPKKRVQVCRGACQAFAGCWGIRRKDLSAGEQDFRASIQNNDLGSWHENKRRDCQVNNHLCRKQLFYFATTRKPLHIFKCLWDTNTIQFPQPPQLQLRLYSYVYLHTLLLTMSLLYLRICDTHFT